MARSRRMQAKLVPGASKVYFRETRGLTVIGALNSTKGARVGILPAKGRAQSFSQVKSLTIGVAPKKIRGEAGGMPVRSYLLPKGVMCEVIHASTKRAAWPNSAGSNFVSCFSHALHVRQRRLRRKRR